MKCEQIMFKQLSFKLCVKALIICLILLATLQIFADEKSAALKAISQAEAAQETATEGAITTPEKAAADAKAAIAAFKSLLGNESIKTEVIVEEIPVEIKTAAEKHLLSKLEITRVETNESSSLVFRSPIYEVKPLLGYVAFVDGELLDLLRPSTNMKLPGYLKLIRDDFVLDSEEQANILANAIEPTISYRLKKIVKPVKIDTGWIIFRNDFFKNYSGLVFTTDENGKITFVEYIMKINPKDFSYKKRKY